MQLHQLISVSKEGDTYIAECDLTDFEGIRYTCDYVVNGGDYFGLAPVVRKAVVDWVQEGKPVAALTAPLAHIPASISFSQMLIGLVSEQWISEADGEGWLGGTLPAAVAAAIDTLPQEQQFAAKARALRPFEVLRVDPLISAIGAAAGKAEAEIDTFFRTYAQV